MIKYSKDDRYDKAAIATHDKHVTSAYACSSLREVKDEAKQFGVIGIDEGQFVSSDYKMCCNDLFNSFQTLLNSVKKWLMMVRQLSWLLLMELFKERQVVILVTSPYHVNGVYRLLIQYWI